MGRSPQGNVETIYQLADAAATMFCYIDLTDSATIMAELVMPPCLLSKLKIIRLNHFFRFFILIPSRIIFL